MTPLDPMVATPPWIVALCVAVNINPAAGGLVVAFNVTGAPLKANRSADKTRGPNESEPRLAGCSSPKDGFFETSGALVTAAMSGAVTGKRMGFDDWFIFSPLCLWFHLPCPTISGRVTVAPGRPAPQLGKGGILKSPFRLGFFSHIWGEIRTRRTPEGNGTPGGRACNRALPLAKEEGAGQKSIHGLGLTLLRAPACLCPEGIC